MPLTFAVRLRRDPENELILGYDWETETFHVIKLRDSSLLRAYHARVMGSLKQEHRILCQGSYRFVVTMLSMLENDDQTATESLLDSIRQVTANLTVTILPTDSEMSMIGAEIHFFDLNLLDRRTIWSDYIQDMRVLL